MENKLHVVLRFSSSSWYTVLINLYFAFEFQGTEKVQSIYLNLSMITELKLSPQAFKQMCNLKFLKFCGQDLIEYSPRKDCNVNLNLKDLESLPDALIYLCWPLYPLKCFPLNFSSENLVELSMPGSQLRRLWTEGQVRLSQFLHVLNVIYGKVIFKTSYSYHNFSCICYRILET